MQVTMRIPDAWLGTINGPWLKDRLGSYLNAPFTLPADPGAGAPEISFRLPAPAVSMLQRLTGDGRAASLRRLGAAYLAVPRADPIKDTSVLPWIPEPKTIDVMPVLLSEKPSENFELAGLEDRWADIAWSDYFEAEAKLGQCRRRLGTLDLRWPSALASIGILDTDIELSHPPSVGYVLVVLGVVGLSVFILWRLVSAAPAAAVAGPGAASLLDGISEAELWRPWMPVGSP